MQACAKLGVLNRLQDDVTSDATLNMAMADPAWANDKSFRLLLRAIESADSPQQSGLPTEWATAPDAYVLADYLDADKSFPSQMEDTCAPYT